MEYTYLETMNIPVGIAVIAYADDWKFVSVNEEWIHLFGYHTRKEFLEIQKEKLIYEKDYSIYEEILQEALQKKTAAEHEFRIRRKDETVCWVRLKCSFAEVIDEVPHLMLVLWDVDKRKHVERKLKLLNQQYKIMEEISTEIPFDLDVESWTLLRSARLYDLKGMYNRKDTYIPFDEEIQEIHPAERENVVKALRKAAREEMAGTVDYRYNIEKPGNSPKYIWFRTYYKSISGEDEKIVRIIGRSCNIEKDKKLQEEVKRDPLTKLLNKIEVQKQTQELLDSGTAGQHIMFLIDIDEFKGINDTFGHTFGDTVICQVAELIHDQFRSNDIVGRVGGDEFVVVMKGVTLEKAVEKAQRLCSALEKEYAGGDVVRKITISVGIAVSGVDGTSYAALFEKADHAMYRAKQLGKNGFQIARKDDVGPLKKYRNINERRGRIERDDQEFLVFAMGLMTHARNIDGSLNMLLQQIASRYDLDLVAICENMPDDKYVMLTNYYSTAFHFFDNTVFAKNMDGIDDIKPGTVKIFDDIPLSMWKKGMAHDIPDSYLDKLGNATSVVGKFEYLGGRIGDIHFISFNRYRVWKKKELNIFLELVRTIAIFISLRFRMDENRDAIRQLQNMDQLTGLYKVDAFRSNYESFLRDWDDNKVYALEYMDINNFGYVNENYGFQVGNNVLKMFAQSLMSQPVFRTGCRLHSDLFVVLVEAENEEELKQAVFMQNRQFMNMQNHKYPSSSMSISCGVYRIESKNVSADVAMENATLAWKNAKKLNIRDMVMFDPKMRQIRIGEQQIVGEFYEALYKDDFQLYLQPKFLLKTKEVYGAEALVRWRKPDGRILAPGQFMEMLEKIGYITDLDFYILEKLLRAMAKWKQQEKRTVVVSVNFSGRHFNGNGEEFISRINSMMKKYGLSTAGIEIEITEGVMVKNRVSLMECMKKLRELGFRIAIDDFGTGYSSLAILTDMPADIVKIDKSFLDKEYSERNVKLIQEIGRMVSIAGKEIIFEGIETEEQRRFLEECGYEYGQGYLCSQPVPIEKFEKKYL